MKQFNYIFSAIGWVGFVACLVILILLDRCQEKSTHTIEKKTTIIYDSSKKEMISKTLPAAVSVFTIPVTQKIDTAEILKAFFASYTYTQQIQDSCIRLNIYDSITQNKILKRLTHYQWLKPVKTIESTTVTVEKNNTGIYVGGFAQANNNDFGFGPELSIATNKNIFHGGYDVRKKYFLIGINFKLNAGRRNKNK